MSETDPAAKAAERIAEVRSSCGRNYLSVAGIAVAMEGDRCRSSGIPEHVLPPIPPEELESATIGGEPAKDMPLDVVRFFRGDNWTPKMLEWAASKINSASETQARAEHLESVLAKVREEAEEWLRVYAAGTEADDRAMVYCARRVLENLNSDEAAGG